MHTKQQRFFLNVDRLELVQILGALVTYRSYFRSQPDDKFPTTMKLIKDINKLLYNND